MRKALSKGIAAASAAAMPLLNFLLIVTPPKLIWLT